MGRCVRIEGEVLRRAERFGIPADGAGVVVAALPLAWAWVDDQLQAVIVDSRVVYPEMRLATREELEELINA